MKYNGEQGSANWGQVRIIVFDTQYYNKKIFWQFYNFLVKVFYLQRLSLKNEMQGTFRF